MDFEGKTESVAHVHGKETGQGTIALGRYGGKQERDLIIHNKGGAGKIYLLRDGKYRRQFSHRTTHFILQLRASQGMQV